MTDFKPFWEEKVWGRVCHLFCNPQAAVSHLEVQSGFRCSRHRHHERANMFAVQEGQLVVEEWANETEYKRLYLLKPGEIVSVPSGMWHRFRVLQGGRLVEVYWADKGGAVRFDDIERDDIGGNDDIAVLKTELFAAGLI